MYKVKSINDQSHEYILHKYDSTFYFLICFLTSFASATISGKSA